MNLEYFIARKVASGGKKSFSRLIIRIAIAAVALSVSVMIITSALIFGFKKEISEKIFGFWGHIHITDNNINSGVLDNEPIDINQTFYPSLDTLRNVTYLTEKIGGDHLEFVETLSHGGIRHIQTFALSPGIIKTKTDIEGIVLKGIGKDFDLKFIQDYLEEGEFIDLKSEKATKDIIVSRQTADRLNVKLGDKFVFHYIQNNEQIKRQFIIKGIYKTGLEEYDRRFALVDIRKIQQLLKWKETEVGGFEVFIDDIRDLDPMTEFIYLERLPNSLYAENIREKFPPIFEWLELQDINQYVIIALMLVVSIINMVTALLILILERTNMIGTLKALGGNNYSIRKIFLYYAAFIVIAGLFWGNLIGLGLCWLQDAFHFVKLSEADYYLSYAPISINWWMVLGVNVGTLVMTVLVLIIPSFLVSRISPVKAIRFK
jgi:lipoprotein-releasing system permease protein